VTVEPDAEDTTAESAAVEPDLVGLGRIEEELADVARALERLDEGTYGTCEACAAVLPDEQLAVAPASRFCTEHEPAVH
jgi:RNA polymerase-binding transcription factor DksA